LGLAAVTLSAPSSKAQPSKDDEFELAQNTQQALLALMGEARPRQQLALFDVRTPDEYRVSHLDGAQRVDPDTGYAHFVAEHGAQLKGKTVVFYCTTSARSGDLALGVRDGLLQSGAKAVAQLAGGLIAWHNAGLPMVNAAGPTPYLHPFDDAVRPHLQHLELTRTQ
jgi:rhodanese-related sulfurtransferase